MKKQLILCLSVLLVFSTVVSSSAYTFDRLNSYMNAYTVEPEAFKMQDYTTDYITEDEKADLAKLGEFDFVMRVNFCANTISYIPMFSRETYKIADPSDAIDVADPFLGQITVEEILRIFITGYDAESGTDSLSYGFATVKNGETVFYKYVKNSENGEKYLTEWDPYPERSITNGAAYHHAPVEEICHYFSQLVVKYISAMDGNIVFQGKEYEIEYSTALCFSGNNWELGNGAYTMLVAFKTNGGWFFMNPYYPAIYSANSVGYSYETLFDRPPYTVYSLAGIVALQESEKELFSLKEKLTKNGSTVRGEDYETYVKKWEQYWLDSIVLSQNSSLYLDGALADAVSVWHSPEGEDGFSPYDEPSASKLNSYYSENNISGDVGVGSVTNAPSDTTGDKKPFAWLAVGAAALLAVTASAAVLCRKKR